MNSNYFIPQEACFNNLICAIWQVERSTTFQKEIIIPKGIVEIIFNFSNNSHILARLNSQTYPLPNCFINGFNTAPIVLHHAEQQVFFGVRFQPFAIKKIFKSPACEFSDVTIDLMLLHPGFQSLWYQLADQDSFDNRVTVFLNWLKGNFIDCDPREQMMNAFLNTIDRHDVSIQELSKLLCYSSRHLSRKIFEATGMNTEEILLYKKYLHAVHLIHHSHLSLTQIAYQSQFSDQSHFIKTFKSYTKMTPGDYKLAKGFMKGHIYKDVR